MDDEQKILCLSQCALGFAVSEVLEKNSDVPVGKKIDASGIEVHDDSYGEFSHQVLYCRC